MVGGTDSAVPFAAGMADPLPKALAGLVSELSQAGFNVTRDESSGDAFREVTLESAERSFGSVVRITKERGMWGVELSVEGDHFHGPNEVLCAVEGRALASRAMGHDEMRAATLEALARMPSSEPEKETVRARLRAYREDYTRRMSGRERDLADARKFFEAGDFRSAIDAYERLREDELSGADRVRLRIARERVDRW